MGKNDTSKYVVSSVDGPLRQGELLSDVRHITVSVTANPRTSSSLSDRNHSFAIILTPDCDLEWDYNARQNGATEGKIVPNILLCKAVTAADLARRVKQANQKLEKFEGSTAWKRIRQNKEERFHFLERVQASLDLKRQNIPSLGVDFKDFFTVPTEDLYSCVNEALTDRRCRLISPYKEHLISRFTYFQSRVALPNEHGYVMGEILQLAK